MPLLPFISKFYEPTASTSFFNSLQSDFSSYACTNLSLRITSTSKSIFIFLCSEVLKTLSVLPYLKLFSPMTLHSFDLLSTTLSLSLPLLPCPSLQIHLNSLSSIQSIRNLTHCHRFDQHLSTYNFIFISAASVSL